MRMTGEFGGEKCFNRSMMRSSWNVIKIGRREEEYRRRIDRIDR